MQANLKSTRWDYKKENLKKPNECYNYNNVIKLIKGYVLKCRWCIQAQMSQYISLCIYGDIERKGFMIGFVSCAGCFYINGKI